MPCHHSWTNIGTEVLSRDEATGLETTKYKHQCPSCGKIKETIRANCKLPPPLKWKHEMEKLLTRAWDAGYRFVYNGEQMATEEIIQVDRLRVEKHP